MRKLILGLIVSFIFQNCTNQISEIEDFPQKFESGKFASNDNNAAAKTAKLKPMGWAATTTSGGNGGRIIKVTNLKKDGEGSLKAALEASGKRIVVFEVGGIIDLEGSNLNLKNDDITVMGQTAPSPGITLIRGPLQIRANNVIIEHLRIRVGEAGKSRSWTPDGISILGAHNVIVDHCSVAWSIDEGISVNGPYFKGKNVDEWRKNTSGTVTISNCIIGEPLHKSTHRKGVSHGYGSLIGRNVREIAMIRNLFANNRDRNPTMGVGTSVALVNNFIFNSYQRHFRYFYNKRAWDKAGHKEIPGSLSIIGNSSKFGTETINGGKGAYFFLSDGHVTLYWKDNQATGGQFSSERVIHSRSGKINMVNSPHMGAWHNSIEVLKAQQAEEYVLNNAGARPWDRDAVDKRIINGVKKGTLPYIDSEKEVGGYPSAKPSHRAFNPGEWNL